jgi:CRP-like cAMP-binding protein
MVKTAKQMAPEFRKFCEYLTQRAGVSPEHVEALLPAVSLKFCKKGEVILAQGAVGEYIYFVEQGLLRFYTIDDQGKEHILQFAPENWWISDRNNFNQNQPSEFFLDAQEDSWVVQLNQSFFLKASEMSKEFRAFHDQLLQRRIFQLYRRVYALIGTSARQRYEEFIKAYPDLTQRVPQWMIASYLGITPESLSRVCREVAGK